MAKIIKLPGLIDGHVHLREPGATHKEDFYTGTAAALAGGITAICDMPNNVLPTSTYRLVKQKIDLSRQKAVCPVYFYLGANQDNLAEFKKVKNIVKGLKIYLDNTTGNLLVTKLNVLLKIFEIWPKNLPILVHAEDSTLLKVIALITLFNKKVHVCHVSSQPELETIIQAKKQGLPITCGVTMHHLFLSQDNLKKLGPFGLMKPELQSKKDVLFLWRNLKWIDTFETDHAGHTQQEKRSKASHFGVPGLETALPLLLTAVKQKKLTLNEILQRFYVNPKKIFNISQPDTTYIEVDLNKKWIINNKKLFCKCRWSPFAGWQVWGKVIRVFIKGKKVFENDKILVKPGAFK